MRIRPAAPDYTGRALPRIHEPEWFL